MTELENRRKQKGYTQQFMAEKIGTSTACYNMYENNQRRTPIEKADKIAEILECNRADIFMPSCFTVSEISVRVHK